MFMCRSNLLSRRIPALFISLTTCLLVCGQGRSDKLLAGVPQQVRAVTINGDEWIYYEIRLTNPTEKMLKLDGITISDAANERVIDSFKGDELAQRIKSITTDKTVCPGSEVYVFIELRLPHTNVATRLLQHEITYTPDSFKQVDGPMLIRFNSPIYRRKATIIGAPLSAGKWAAIYDPAWERGHRRVQFNIRNETSLPGRFAIDFVKLDDIGRYSTGNEDSIETWYGYGATVLAVADGIVTASIDTFTESETLAAHPQYEAGRATGNYITLKVADSVYAFYEHLKPGSITVKVGDYVRAGQTIAALGFTGQSTGPHLHFHMADTNSPLEAEGIPYLFKKFRYVGHYRNFADFGKRMWVSQNSSKHPTTNEIPAPNAVIEFKFE
jgi:peptidase M23-like protein